MNEPLPQVGCGEALGARDRRVRRERDGGRAVDCQDRRPRRDAGAGDGRPGDQPRRAADARDGRRSLRQCAGEGDTAAVEGRVGIAIGIVVGPDGDDRHGHRIAQRGGIAAEDVDHDDAQLDRAVDQGKGQLDPEVVGLAVGIIGQRGEALGAAGRRLGRERDGGRAVDGQDHRPRRDAGTTDVLPGDQPRRAADARDRRRSARQCAGEADGLSDRRVLDHRNRGGEALGVTDRRVLREHDRAGRAADGQDRRPRRDAGAGDGLPCGQPRRAAEARDGRQSARQCAGEADELEQLDFIARPGRADELRRAVAGDIVPHDPRVAGGVEAEVGHLGRRRVVDQKRDGIARGRAETGVLGIRRLDVDLEGPIG